MSHDVDTPHDPNLKDLFLLYVERVERQDNLVNQRLKWMLTSQGALFTLVAAFEKYLNDPSAQILSFASIGVIVGLLISFSGLIGVIGGQLAMEQLVEKWSAMSDDSYPLLIGESRAKKLGFGSAWLVPASLFLGWVLVGLNIWFIGE